MLLPHPHPARHAAALVLLGMLCSVSPLAGSEPGWHLEGAAVEWKVTGEVKKDRDVSGVLITREGLGALVSDETRAAQEFSYSRTSREIRIGSLLPFLPGKGTEIDMEAAALSPDGTRAYFTGSHSMARKKGVLEPERSNVFRVEVNSRGGFTKKIDQGNFRTVINTQSALANALDKAADGTGVDIEGLAVHSDKLLVGFRAPLVDGMAVILEVPEKDVFGGAKTTGETTLHRINLGTGRGIREMLRIPDGFLLIAGDTASDTDKSTFELFHWSGPETDQLQCIGPISDPPGKAEALGLLHSTPDEMEILILFDGASNGGPRSQLLKKK